MLEQKKLLLVVSLSYRKMLKGGIVGMSCDGVSPSSGYLLLVFCTGDIAFPHTYPDISPYLTILCQYTVLLFPTPCTL